MTRIEVLSFDGCPGGPGALEIARRIAGEFGDDIEVTDVLVSQHDADRLRFLGSPSIRVDGLDVDVASRGRTTYHFGCRLYETDAGRAGLPPEAWVRAALHEARGTRR